MTVEVTDNGSDRVTEGDTLMEGEEHGKDWGGGKGDQSYTSAFKPALKGFLIMLIVRRGGQMWAFGHH